MKPVGEVLRWPVVLACTAPGFGILVVAWRSLSTGLSWPASLVLGAVTVCLAAIPFVAAWLAYESRWREFLALFTLVLTIIACGVLLTIPSLISLLEEAPLNSEGPWFPSWISLVNAAAHLVFFFASFPFANWVYRQLLRVLDRFFPPKVATKDWIRQAC